MSIFDVGFEKGRTVRHHNLLYTQGKPPITGPVNKGKGRGNTAGKGHGKPPWAASATDANVVVSQFAANTLTGSQTLTDTALGGATPKAVIVFVSANGVDDDVRPYAIQSIGFAGGGAGARSVSSTYRNSTSGGAYTRSSSTYLGALYENSANLFFAFTLTSLTTNGMTINITKNDYAVAVRITVMFFYGDDVSVAVGNNNFSSGSRTITTTWQPSAMFFASPYSWSAFDDTGSVEQFLSAYGMASYDGTTTRQTSIGTRTLNTNPSQTFGGISSSKALIIPQSSGTLSELTCAGSSTGFTLSGAPVDAMQFMYLAIKGFDAHVVSGASPTSTGVQPWPSTGGPSWIPEAALLMVSDIADGAKDTCVTAGHGMGLGFITPDDDYARSWRIEDATATLASENGNWPDAVHYESHVGTLIHEGSFDSFDTGEVNINYSTANGTARHWGGMFLRAAA